MHESPKEFVMDSALLLFAHPALVGLGMIAAIYIFVAALNEHEKNVIGIRMAALAVTGCITFAWILGDYWYAQFYGPEKAIILKGPLSFAHNMFMETKEHLLFISLILALYLPIAAGDKLFSNKAARSMVLVVSALITLNLVVIEGADAVINYDAKAAFVHTGVIGAE